MIRERFSNLGRSDIPLLACSILVFLFGAFYAYLDWNVPKLGFVFNASDWEVFGSDEPDCESPCVQIGDQILALGSITKEEAAGNRRVYLFEDFGDESHIAVDVDVLRGGETLTIPVKASRKPGSSYLVWFFPLVFWLAGTIAIIFLRPRDARWLVLVSLYYSVALWGSAGLISTSQISYSSLLFRIFVWPFPALLLHLHLIFPDRRFPRLEKWLLGPTYAMCFLLMVLDYFLILEQGWVLVAIMGAIGMSVSLLIYRLASGDETVSRLLGFGFGVGLLPIMLQVLIFSTQEHNSIGSGLYDTLNGVLFLAVLPFWPFSYLYALYRHGDGAVEFRANRILSTYGFYALYTTLFVAFFMVGSRWTHHDETQQLAFSLILSLAFVVMTTPLREGFNRFVNRQLYGIYYEPHQVLSRFAELIPSSFNRTTLERVIQKEILPTLMVRRSALYAMEDEQVKAIYEQDVPGELPTMDELRRFRVRVRPFKSLNLSSDERFPWVRLCIPLATQDRVIGLWLLGRRDPDDFYPRTDIQLLSRLANQIAPVIENVRLVEMARQEVEENRRLQEQLVQSQKMEAIGRLSAGVAHDFNNLLSVILGYSSLLIARYRSDDSLNKYLSDIRDAGNRAAALTKQLLAFSRQQVMEATTMDLNTVVVDVEKMLRRLTGEDIEVRAELESDLPSVKIDPGQMGQVIINLAVNARDAMPEGGRILISTELKVLRVSDEDPQQGTIPAGTYVAMTLADSGTGIEPDLIHRIFEPYFTTKELGKGTGLGLSMVYGIINQSKGYIRVSSTLGVGTSFSIFLPASHGAVSEPVAETVATPASDVGAETILVVEDEESVRQVACEILASKGYRVIEAATAAEAMELFEQRQAPIDLLLTDVIMPHMKGPELASRLLTVDPQLRVVFMSGYNEESILGRRIGEEGTLLIQKPFTPNGLARQIRQVLDLPREAPAFSELGSLP